MEKKEVKQYELEFGKICKENGVAIDKKGHDKIQALDVDEYYKPLILQLKEFVAGKEKDYVLKVGKISLYASREIEEEKVKHPTLVEAGSFISSKKNLSGHFYKIQPFFYDRAKIWWIWNFDKFCWEQIDETDILNALSKSSGVDTINSKERTELLECLKQGGRLLIPKPIKKTWIQFKNKIYDIHTGEEFEATPEYFVTNPIPYELHKEKFMETPTIDEIFEEWVGKAHAQTLYEILAYCLIPDYPVHRLFCLIGSGLNGKSCFLRLLKKFIGQSNVTATELDTLINSRFEVTRLYKKLVCLMGETNFSEMSKTSIIKKLTGQDTIGFEYKNKTPFEDENYAKIIIATNNLPSTTDKTLGFYRRWLIIDFPNRFSEKEDILNKIPEEEYECLALKCAHLLKDLLDKREFTNEGSIEERTQRYEDKSNPFDKFWKENVIEGTGFIWKHEFKARLQEWCVMHRARELGEVTIAKEMKIRHVETERKFTEEANKYGERPRWRAWVGVAWKDVHPVQDVHVNLG